MRNILTHLILVTLWPLLMPGLSQAITVVGSLTHEQSAQPGQEYSGAIRISNNSMVAEEAVIYQTDYTFQADGAVYYHRPGTLSRSNAAWITINPKRILVEPHSVATVYYQVRVPEHLQNPDQPLEGTFWSIIMVESVPKQKVPVPQEGQIAIRSKIRYGIQIVTHLGQNPEKGLQFINTRLYKDEEHYKLQVDVANTGDTWLIPKVSVELFDREGHHVDSFAAHSSRTYPGTSARYLLDLKVPQGMYKALIVADCGGEDLFGNQLTLNIE